MPLQGLGGGWLGVGAREMVAMSDARANFGSESTLVECGFHMSPIAPHAPRSVVVETTAPRRAVGYSFLFPPARVRKRARGCGSSWRDQVEVYECCSKGLE